MIDIKGHCDPRFAAVKAAFTENFSSLDEVGAAVSIHIGDEKVVDLWGGVACRETNTDWEENTLANIWSTTKGVTAACFARAVELGAFKYSDKVAQYWPEFGVHGKQGVTVAMLLSHQAGLCGFRNPITVDMFYDLELAANTLAASEPFWEPGTQAGYHAITAGILASAFLRRAEGRTVGEFVKDELNAKSGLDISVGVPADQIKRCATMIAPPAMSSQALSTEFTPAQISALANPPLDPLVANTPAWRAAEIPSANGYATARALAKLYAALASNGPLSGHPFVGKETISEATTVQWEGMDAVVATPARWACGFLRNSNECYGPAEDVFGHSGWGGSFAMGHPGSGAGMAYTMNRMGTDLIGDPRSMALISAFYSSL